MPRQRAPLGQTLNATNGRLVVRPESGIRGVPDLRNKKIGTRGMHPGLNDWLYLKQRGLDVDKDEVGILAKEEHQNKSTYDMILDGDVDAALMTPPTSDPGVKGIGG